VPDHALAMTEIGTCLARSGRRNRGHSLSGRRLDDQSASCAGALQPSASRSSPTATGKKPSGRLDNSIALDAGFADAYRDQGLAYAMGGEYDLAASDLRALIALDTKDYGAIIQLGADFGKAAREKQAARLFEGSRPRPRRTRRFRNMSTASS